MSECMSSTCLFILMLLKDVFTQNKKMLFFFSDKIGETYLRSDTSPLLSVELFLKDHI